MTIPDEMLQPAAVAVLAASVGGEPTCNCDDCTQKARSLAEAAIIAVFTMLPECKSARAPGHESYPSRIGWNACLAHLAKLGVLV